MWEKRLRDFREELLRTALPFEVLLERHGGAPRDALLRTTAEMFGLEFLEAFPAEISGDVLKMLPRGTAQRLGAVPVERRGKKLCVALVDPLNGGAVSELAFVLNQEVCVVVAEPRSVRHLLQRHYSGRAETAMLGMCRDGASVASKAIGVEELEKLAAEGSVIKQVNDLLTRAIDAGVADLHFEPFERELLVRARIDGGLCEYARLPSAMALGVSTRLKILAQLDIAEQRRPQDGRMCFAHSQGGVDCRVATLATQYGELVVVRILKGHLAVETLQELGMPEELRVRVEGAIGKPHGLILVTGPTGSGKTTTLYACLRHLNAANRKLLTIEDPVERVIEGVVQVPVAGQGGMSFEGALRAFLRHDPDVIFVGEIRDRETAQVALRAAITGHLVFSTLHTRDALGTVGRLIDLGVEPFLLASALEGVLAQRLVRRLCSECRCERVASAEFRRVFEAADSGKAFSGVGCEACGGTGFRGRMGVYEWLPVEVELRQALAEGKPLDVLRARAVANGFCDLRVALRAAVLAGETTEAEALRLVETRDFLV